MKIISLQESNSDKDNQDARMKRWVANNSDFVNCPNSIVHHMAYDAHNPNNFKASYDDKQRKNCIFISNCDGSAKILHSLFEFCIKNILPDEIYKSISLLPIKVFIVNKDDKVEELSIVQAIDYQEEFRRNKGLYL